MSDSGLIVEAEVQHYTKVLRIAIRSAGLTMTEVERRLGNGPKSLRRVFSGEVDLKFKHVILVLDVIGLSQEEFFTIASRGRRSNKPPSMGAEFMAAFRSMGYRDELAPVPEDPDEPRDEDEFDRMVVDAMRRVLRRQARADKPAQRPASQERVGKERGSNGRDGESEP
jgi:hypothetical protein